MTLIATMLADMPDLRLRVQAQHVPDQNGFCADCRDSIRWPCDVYRIAAEAERRGGPGHRGGAGLPWSPPSTAAMHLTAATHRPAPTHVPAPPYLPEPGRRRYI